MEILFCLIIKHPNDKMISITFFFFFFFSFLIINLKITQVIRYNNLSMLHVKLLFKNLVLKINEYS